VEHEPLHREAHIHEALLLAIAVVIIVAVVVVAAFCLTIGVNIQRAEHERVKQHQRLELPHYNDGLHREIGRRRAAGVGVGVAGLLEMIVLMVAIVSLVRRRLRCWYWCCG